MSSRKARSRKVSSRGSLKGFHHYAGNCKRLRKQFAKSARQNTKRALRAGSED